MAVATGMPRTRAAPSAGIGLVVRAAVRPHAAALVLIGVLMAALFFQHAGSLGLLSDDWSHLALNGVVPLGAQVGTWPLDYRPFDALPWWAFYHVFGTALAGYYVVLFGVAAATALLLYLLVYRLCGSAWAATGCAVIWAVHPADSTQFWLSTLHYHLGLLCFMAGLVLLVAGDRLSPGRYAGAIVCCALTMASNELYLGALLSYPALAALRRPASGPAVRLLRGLPFLALIGLDVWYRLWFGPQVLHLFDNTGAPVHPTLASMLGTERDGFLVVLLQGWQAALTTAQHGLLAPWAPTPHDERSLLMFTFEPPPGLGPERLYLAEVYAVVLGLAAILWIGRARYPAIWQRVRPGVLLLGVGVIWIAAGYLTLSALSDQPSLNGIDTRVNVAAVPGGALCVVGLIWTLISVAPLPRAASRLLFAAGVGGFALVGIVRVQHTAALYVDGWTAQRQVWREALAAMPALQPHTFVVMAARDAAASERIVALQQWGVAYFLRLAYPGKDVSGDYLGSGDGTAACTGVGWAIHLTPRGLQPHGIGMYQSYADIYVPYRDVVVLAYDGAGRVSVARGPYRPTGGRCTLFSHAERIIPVGHSAVPATASLAGRLVQ